MKRFLLIALLLLILPNLSFSFEDPELASAAKKYKQKIEKNYSTDGEAPKFPSVNKRLIDRLWHWIRPLFYKSVDEEKKSRELIATYESNIAAGDNSTDTWLALSAAWGNDPTPDLVFALASAYYAYEHATSSFEQSIILSIMGALYEKKENPRRAMRVYSEVLSIEYNPRISERLKQLTEQYGFQLVNVEVDRDSADTRFCLMFSSDLPGRRRVKYGDYLRIEPAIDASFSVDGKRLCVTGGVHGGSYEVTLKEGLRDAAGERIRAETVTVNLPDRRPSIGFKGYAFILPRTFSQGVPLMTVNVDKVKLKVMRINDRNLIHSINRRRVSTSLTKYEIDDLWKNRGEAIWEGEMTIRAKRNVQATTSFPLMEVLEESKPGIYVVVAERVGMERPGYQARATQWVVITDIGLSLFKGIDGLHVFARSLKSAKPLPGIKLTLLAKNNEKLAEATADSEGYARFSPGLLRGVGGMSSTAVTAFSGTGDFVFLDLIQPAFDFRDRGVEGRKAAGPVDVFIYSDRGVYRPGEKVNVVALMRDGQGQGIAGASLTLKVLRPDGVESQKIFLKEGYSGGYHTALPLGVSAMTGSWTVLAYTDTTAAPVGQLDFQVEDFVPQRMELKLKPESKFLLPGSETGVGIKGRFLYGAPAENLKVEAELILKKDENPYPGHPGYDFGLVDEEWLPKRIQLEAKNTDSTGKSRLAILLPQLPAAAQPLKAIVRTTLFERGGRPVSSSLSLPIRYKPFAIGIRPRFKGGELKKGQEALFDIIAVNQDGTLRTAKQLHYELIEEHYDSSWYYSSGTWNFSEKIRDEGIIQSGKLSIEGNKPGSISQMLPWGSYRLEVFDPQTAVATSVRFRVGWFVSSELLDTPDKLEVNLDKKKYKVGDIARVHVRPPFDGEMLLTVASDRLHKKISFFAQSSGTTIELPVSGDWGSGVYVVATAFRPGQSTAKHGPNRAIGLAWLPLDTSDRRLSLTMELPETVRPRQKIEVPISIDGIDPGAHAFLTLAAVDEGILQLTEYKSPDPFDHYFGKRQLGMELRDAYGRLIDGRAGERGRIRSGGGMGSARRNNRVVPAQAIKTVSLFSSPVELDSRGKVKISLQLPDFNGQLRLVAVAWDLSRVGSYETSLTVRDPLVAQVSLPRFLAPGDESRITLNLHNLNAPEGEYRMELTAKDGVDIPARSLIFRLTKDKRSSWSLKLRALSVGTGFIRMVISGPENFKLERKWEISVRPAQPLQTYVNTRRLAPENLVMVGSDKLAKFLPGTSEVLMSFSDRPNMDIPGLLRGLSLYPYGCLEQTISVAFPLLYLNEVAMLWTKNVKKEKNVDESINSAIFRILNMQRPDGSFGLWGPRSVREEWLSAYAMDFLSRAKQKGFIVPDYAYKKGLKWLEESIRELNYSQNSLPSRAYSFYVLTRTGVVRIGDLRYFHDNYLKSLPTVLAKAQVAAALVFYGDMKRAEEAFSEALSSRERTAAYDLRDYGSELRDTAGLVAMMIEIDAWQERVPKMVERLTDLWATERYTSTQEKAWLLLAARELLKGDEEMVLSINGKAIPPRRRPLFLRPGNGKIKNGYRVKNLSLNPMWYTLTLNGVPKRELPSVDKGFKISRKFYYLDGSEVDLNRVRQNDLLLAVIKGEVNTDKRHQALVVDLLPAGFEIENPHLKHSRKAEEFSWLPELSETNHTDYLGDRFIAAVDTGQDQREFIVAYIVRAVTPGKYNLPAVFVEDMVKPRYHGRQGMGTVTVLPRNG